MTVDVSDARFLRAITAAQEAPRPPLPAVAFAGRSNVGKSSVINALVRKKGLAKTSSTPGRTQLIVYFEVAGRFHFIDLPGYGYAKVPLEVKARWGPMVERFLREVEGLRLVIVILDARREPTSEDRQLIEWLEAAGTPYFFVMTKADKLGKNELEKRIQGVEKALGVQGKGALLPFSATTGQGRKELLHVILESLGARAELAEERP